jgi:hypothetical protein
MPTQTVELPQFPLAGNTAQRDDRCRARARVGPGVLVTPRPVAENEPTGGGTSRR